MDCLSKHILRAWNILLCCFFLVQGWTQKLPVFIEDTVVVSDTFTKTQLLVVEERKVPDSLIKALKNDDAFWYANAAAEKKADPVVSRKGIIGFLQKAWVRNLLWIIFVGCFIVITIWFLAVSNLQLFRSKPKTVTAETED
ncbi:MAG TPA: hypothetical protein VM888_14715, partial [Chitinophagaceae bacterium]|nr:hypothetical protein [Chitinophagaceae bacterium]